MQDRGGPRVRRRTDRTRAVPTDQQPFNELQELREDPLFGWAQEDLKVPSESGCTCLLESNPLAWMLMLHGSR